MAYLMIRNPGIADHKALTLLGASTTRNNAGNGSIGMFGSGFKYSCALLLRKGIKFHVMCGNLKMEFHTKAVEIQRQIFNQVCVTYSGKDNDGNSINRTQDLGFTTEWGAMDWLCPSMAFREFIANAIDGSILNSGSFGATELGVVDKPRAKANTTAIFIPESTEIVEAFRKATGMFLYFSKPDELKNKLLTKSNPNETRFYKKGVLIYKTNAPSIFDYNFDNEVQLDESRNAKECDVQFAAALLIARSDQDNISKFLKGMNEEPKSWERKIDPYALRRGHIDNWQSAFKNSFSDKAVATTGMLDDHIKAKGYLPVKFEHDFVQTFKYYGIRNEFDILTDVEKKGYDIGEASVDMKLAVDNIWNKLVILGLTRGRSKPTVMGFNAIMDGESQTYGYYHDGVCYLHNDLAVGYNAQLIKVAIEEIAHHVTQSADNSRDFQDYAFRLAAALFTGQ